MTPGRQRLAAHAQLPRHRHAEPYAAVVLRGGYLEAGDSGRRRVGPGDVIFHRAFVAHADAIDVLGAEVLNLPAASAMNAPFATVSDPDAIARLAERGVTEASRVLETVAEPLESAENDWPDRLARDLVLDANLNLGLWAATQGLAPATVSRGFRAAFGVSPRRFRLEARARAAIEKLVVGQEPLAAIAADVGFADQSHLTRAVAALTGRSPTQLR
jgi:AraC-like DNA-binding protein